MTPKERDEKLFREAMEPLPNYQEVIREEYIKALKTVNERPVLDLDDPCN